MTTTEVPAVLVRCCECGAEKPAPKRLPTGWKRVEESVTCGECWQKRLCLRAVTMRVAKPDGMGWPELRKLLRESFEATTAAANFVMREMAKVEPGFVDVDGKMKLGKLPKCYFYPEIRKRWPLLATCSVNTLEQLVQSKYRAQRLDMARGRKSLPSFRYPQPIPVHNATWSVSEGEDGGIVLSFLLSGQRVRLVLRGGSQYRRQTNDVRRIIKGEVKQCQLDVYEEGTFPNTKLLVKMVGWFPRQERTGSFAASLVTGPVARGGGDDEQVQVDGVQATAATPAFLTLYNDEQRTIYRWNADHVRGWIAAQDERMQRLREDLKAEKRLGRDRDGILAQMDLLERDHHNRMHSFCHEVSAQVVEHLRRRRCGTLLFVDRDRSYFRHFPWAKLSGMLADKSKRAGIEFIASGDAVSESP